MTDRETISLDGQEGVQLASFRAVEREDQYHFRRCHVRSSFLGRKSSNSVPDDQQLLCGIVGGIGRLRRRSQLYSLSTMELLLRAFQSAMPASGGVVDVNADGLQLA